MTVTEFIAGNLQIDDLQFHNPLHRQMLAEAVSHIHDEGFRAEHYFGTHPNPDISRYAVNLANERYTLSKYHTKSQKIVTDEERLYELVPHVMTDFKHAIVEEELKHTQQALLDPENMHDESRYLSIMKHYKDLSEVQRIMAKRLGDRVLNV